VLTHDEAQKINNCGDNHNPYAGSDVQISNKNKTGNEQKICPGSPPDQIKKNKYPKNEKQRTE